MKLSDIPFNDENAWGLLQSGHAKGIFQCESRLVQQWLRRIKPINIWELSAVLAIVRPGPLKSGFADEYVEYRNGNKEFESFGHPDIDDIFEVTDHVMIYQEQIMELGARLAWLDLPQKEKLVKVDNLRKGVAKKDQKKLNAIGREFVEGCIKNKTLDEELANKLFEIIKNCGRYVFNLSHSCSYARVAYVTAYLKYYYPKEFFCVYLSYSRFKLKKWEELLELVREANVLGLKILGPNINSKNEFFAIEEEGIRYGLSDIKYFGKNTINLIKELPVIHDWRQLLLLSCTTEFGKKLGLKPTECLIFTGAFSDTKVSRQDLYSLYSYTNQLSPKEKEWVFDRIHDCDTTKEFAELILRCAVEGSRSTRVEKVRSIGELLKHSLGKEDNPVWIEQQEKYYLGVPITASAIDSKKTLALDKCMECTEDAQLWATKEVGLVLDEIRFTETKKGKNPGQRMAIITGHDTTGELNLPIFPELFAECEDLLIVRNIVQISVKKGRTGWFAENMYKL